MAESIGSTELSGIKMPPVVVYTNCKPFAMGMAVGVWGPGFGYHVSIIGPDVAIRFEIVEKTAIQEKIAEMRKAGYHPAEKCDIIAAILAELVPYGTEKVVHIISEYRNELFGVATYDRSVENYDEPKWGLGKASFDELPNEFVGLFVRRTIPKIVPGHVEGVEMTQVV